MAEPKASFIAASLALLSACAAKETRFPPKIPYPCCQEYGIDVNRVLGTQAIYCGVLGDGTESKAGVKWRQVVVACVRAAQAAGRAFVLDYEYSDGFMYDRVVVAFGEKGEKIYMQSHRDCEGEYYSLGECAEMKITDAASVEIDGCRWDEESLRSRLKPTRPPGSER